MKDTLSSGQPSVNRDFKWFGKFLGHPNDYEQTVKLLSYNNYVVKTISYVYTVFE